MKENYLDPELPEKQQTEPEKAEATAPKITLDNEVFRAQPGEEQMKIKLELEGGNQLRVNTFQNDSLVNTEQFQIDRSSFTYQYKPQKGQTRLNFQLVDDQNRIHAKSVDILMDQPKTDESPTPTLQDSARLEIGRPSYTLEDGQKKVRVELNLNKGSQLEVSTFVDDRLVHSEEFQVKNDDFTYEFEPRQQKSRLRFRVIDPQDRIHTKQVVLSHQPIDRELEHLLTALEQFRHDTIRKS